MVGITTTTLKDGSIKSAKNHQFTEYLTNQSYSAQALYFFNRILNFRSNKVERRRQIKRTGEAGRSHGLTILEYSVFSFLCAKTHRDLHALLSLVWKGGRQSKFLAKTQNRCQGRIRKGVRDRDRDDLSYSWQPPIAGCFRQVFLPRSILKCRDGVSAFSRRLLRHGIRRPKAACFAAKYWD